MSKNIKKVSSQKSTNIAAIRRTYYKQLLDWIFSSDRDQDTLIEIINNLRVDNSTLMKRVISYFYSYPHIINYINKYMNRLYDYNKIDIVDFMYTVCYIVDINKIINPKKLYFHNSTRSALEREQLYQLFDIYFNDIINLPYSKRDISAMCNLVSVGVISDDHIARIDELINNRSTISRQYNEYISNESLSSEIEEFCKWMKEKIKSSCQGCPMYGKTPVILDTNVKTKQPVDIMFIGLNPGKEEEAQDKPFVGKSGQLLRKKIAELPPDTTWIITNIILCSTHTERDIIQPEKTIQNCTRMLAEIYKAFPSKTIVTLGAKATEAVGITEKITSAAGKVFKMNDITIVPVLHPSSAVNYGKLEPFNRSFETVYKLFGNKPISVPKQPQKIDSKPQEVTKDDTLFDIKKLDQDRILKIFISRDGKKKYIVEYPKFKVYIKYGSFKECLQTSSSMDAVIELQLKEYLDLQQKLRRREERDVVLHQ